MSLYIVSRDVRSTGIPIPMGSHSHSPGIAHSRKYDDFGFKNLIPIPVIFPGNMTHSRGIPHSRKIPFFTKFEKNWTKKMMIFETKPHSIIFFVSWYNKFHLINANKQDQNISSFLFGNISNVWWVSLV